MNVSSSPGWWMSRAVKSATAGSSEPLRCTMTGLRVAEEHWWLMNLQGSLSVVGDESLLMADSFP